MKPMKLIWLMIYPISLTPDVMETEDRHWEHYPYQFLTKLKLNMLFKLLKYLDRFATII